VTHIIQQAAHRPGQEWYVAYVDPAEGKQNYENDLRCDGADRLV